MNIIMHSVIIHSIIHYVIHYYSVDLQVLGFLP